MNHRTWLKNSLALQTEVGPAAYRTFRQISELKKVNRSASPLKIELSKLRLNIYIERECGWELPPTEQHRGPDLCNCEIRGRGAVNRKKCHFTMSVCGPVSLPTSLFQLYSNTLPAKHSHLTFPPQAAKRRCVNWDTHRGTQDRRRGSQNGWWCLRTKIRSGIGGGLLHKRSAPEIV